eukprot:6169203-Amphidinium_carterae.1
MEPTLTTRPAPLARSIGRKALLGQFEDQQTTKCETGHAPTLKRRVKSKDDKRQAAKSPQGVFALSVVAKHYLASIPFRSAPE